MLFRKNSTNAHIYLYQSELSKYLKLIHQSLIRHRLRSWSQVTPLFFHLARRTLRLLFEITWNGKGERLSELVHRRIQKIQLMVHYLTSFVPTRTNKTNRSSWLDALVIPGWTVSEKPMRWILTSCWCRILAWLTLSKTGHGNHYITPMPQSSRWNFAAPFNMITQSAKGTSVEAHS